MSSLRVLIYDRTQLSRSPRLLGRSWQVGAGLYRALGRIDGAFGASSFEEAFSWLARFRPDLPLSELQFWGHGKWGRAFIDQDAWDRSAFNQGHRLQPAMHALRERLQPGALLWFRTCETLGAEAGHGFADALAEFSGARVAGHTHVIGFFQSGLHLLAPGSRPHWSTSEGLLRGTPARPEAAQTSTPSAPNTVTCLDGAVPAHCAVT